ncbi:MAG TPA: hypothetical protein VIJ14_10320 [Rhabdochlamydiaceae bacterium]
MAYENMVSKKKIVDKERSAGGKTVKRKDMPAVDKLTAGKKEAVVERTKAKTKQTENKAYMAKMKKDNKKKDC